MPVLVQPSFPILKPFQYFKSAPCGKKEWAVRPQSSGPVRTPLQLATKTNPLHWKDCGTRFPTIADWQITGLRSYSRSSLWYFSLSQHTCSHIYTNVFNCSLKGNYHYSVIYRVIDKTKLNPDSKASFFIQNRLDTLAWNLIKMGVSIQRQMDKGNNAKWNTEKIYILLDFPFPMYSEIWFT